MTTRRTMVKEPTLREILAEPIIRAVMDRDGVSAGDVAGAIRNARRRLNGARGIPHVDVTARRQQADIAGAGKLNAPDPNSWRAAWKR